jgi:hypothetical protein
MNKDILLAAAILTFLACNGRPKAPTASIDSTPSEPFKIPAVHTIYTQTVCHGNACSYVHYLMLDTYDEAKFDDYHFVDLADGYLDTVKTALPVAAIQFCRPFSFRDIGGTENDEQLKDHAITLLFYKEDYKGKLPEISSVTIWDNGHPKQLDWMDIETRKRRTK